MPANEKVARSVALEEAYVHDVYEQFLENPKNKPWPRVQQFLEDLERGSIICDVGCGNGKYLNTNTTLFNIGGDKSMRLCETARDKKHEVLILDNLKLPFKDESLDAVLSIAVVHHLATTERRIRALRELARVLRIGGRIIITVWAMEQSHRKFESQDVLVPWHRPQQLSTPSLELVSTTTSDEEFLPPYHAYTQSDTDSNKSTRDKGGTFKKKGRSRHKGRSIDPGCSTSPSSSSLSSPNETCYSFVRRAIQKLAGGRRGTHRPWFLESWSVTNRDPSAKRLEESYCNCCDCDDIQNLPIELRRVDDEELPQRRQTLPSSQLISDIYSNLKSRSLTDIKLVENNNIVRSKSSVPSIQEIVNIKEENDTKPPQTVSTKPKLVKQKQSICDEDAEEDLDKPTDMKSLINTLPNFGAYPNSKSRLNVLKQRSLNEELMSVERFQENERVKQNIQKQASLNDDLIYRRHRKLDYFKDSFFSVSTSKKLQLIKTGFTRKIKNSTTNIERVTSSSLRNGFVKMFQKWNTVEIVSPTIPENEIVIKSPGIIPATSNDEKKDNSTAERRPSKEDGSDSSKDSSLQSDTSVDSEDSFASVIFVPKTDPTSPSSHSPSVPTSPRVNNTSVPNSPRIKQSSCPTSPRIKQTPLSIYPLTKQLSSPRPTTSTVKSVFDIPTSSITNDRVERDQIQEVFKVQTLAQKYSVPQIPKFRKTSLNSEIDTVSELKQPESKKSDSDRLKHIKQLLMQKAEYGLRSVRSNYPIVRRSSMSNGKYDIIAKPLPKLLSLELFNPETDDKDSDSSAVSSPDSVESVVENKTKVNRHSKFSFASADIKQKMHEKAPKNLLEAAASVASSLDEAVEKVIRSSPKGKGKHLKKGDVSVIYRQFESDKDPLLAEDEATGNDETTSWDIECQKHLTDFADKLSEKLIKEIDQYRETMNDNDASVPNSSSDSVSDQYISRLSEELNDLSKLAEEIQKQNEYLAKLSLRDNFYNSLHCDNCRAMFCNCINKHKQKVISQTELKQEPHYKYNVNGISDEKAILCESSAKICDVNESTTDDVAKNSNKNETKCSDASELTIILPCRTACKSALKKGASVESCESEKGSSSNSVVSSVATSVHFGLSMESTDGISDRGSSDSQKETSSISKYSDYGSTASLISCPDWSTIKNKIPEERVSFDEKLQIKEVCSTSSVKEASCLNPSLSDASQESLPSDNMGGAITYHRYYHVFREGELDQLIEKYVHNLHIISSYYDHASWCVVAEKVQVWTI